MVTLRYVLVASLFLGCGKSKPVEPQEEPQTDFEKRQETLLADFLKDGFVISKTQAGGIEDEGDSLLFTGLALGVIDCDKIQPILDGLDRMQGHWGGYLVRIDPLPEEYIKKTNMISRDGATGALFGLQRAAKRCPSEAPRISEILQKWKSAIGGKLILYPGSLAGIITPSFRTFMKLAYGTAVSDVEYEEMIISALVSAALIVKTKAACYPIHLQTIQNIAMEQMGHPIYARNKKEWCALVSKRGLLLTDWYCKENRDALEEWLKDPDKSSHVYQHQRCNWENADSDGKLSPRVDFLILSKLLKEGSVL